MGHLLRNASSLELCLPRKECAHRGGLSASLWTQVMPAHTPDTSQRSSWFRAYFSESCFYIGSFFPFYSIPPIWHGNLFLEPLHIGNMWSFVNLWGVHRQLDFVAQRAFGTWTFDHLELLRVKHNKKFTSVLKLGPVICCCCCGSLSYLSEDALSIHYFFLYLKPIVSSLPLIPSKNPRKHPLDLL